MTSQTPDRSIPYQQPGAGRLRDLDGRRWRGQARREALVERAVAAPGVGFVQVVVVGGVVGGGWQQEAAVGGVRLLRAGAAVAGHHLPPDQQLLRD